MTEINRCIGLCSQSNEYTRNKSLYMGLGDHDPQVLTIQTSAQSIKLSNTFGWVSNLGLMTIKGDPCFMVHLD